MSWIEPENEDQYIYHYTSWEVLVAYILPDGQLRLGPFKGTSDPYEFTDWSPMSFGMGDKSLADSSRKATYGLWQLKDRTKLVAFASDGHPGWEKDIYRRGFSRPPMWAHYAGRFEGVCLVFDREVLLNKVVKTFPEASHVFSGKATYSLPPRSGPAYRINMNQVDDLGVDRFLHQHIEQFKTELFFSKQEDWRYEQEFRIVVVTSEEGDAFVEIRDSLCGVVLGHQCPLEPYVLGSFGGYRFEVRHLKYSYGKMQLTK